MSSLPHQTRQQRLAAEVGTYFKQAPEQVALLYPSPYHTGMSSLGFQTLYRAINEHPGRCAERAFAPDEAARPDTAATLSTYESGRPVSGFPVLAISVAYEIEIEGLMRLFELSGVEPLSEHRGKHSPFVLIGGPLTFSNPLPLAPFADAILMGEADETVHQALDIIFQSPSRAAAIEAISEHIPSAFVPSLHGDQMPPIARCRDELLPATAAIRTPHTELSNMFLLEAERGCSRGCAYCVMRRSTNGGMRIVPKERILDLIPADAPRVGLVGAAVSDHPQIAQIVEELADQGRQVGLSSLRPERLNDRLLAALKRAGYRTLTTASDGASQRLRDTIQRHARQEHLVRAAQLARKHKMARLKLYMMVGLPDERDEDIDELARFSVELSKLIPLSLGIAPFVAKRNTPLDGLPFAGMEVVDQRLKRLRKSLRGRVELRPTSSRWAWVEYVLAQGGRQEGLAVLEAYRDGGGFRSYKRAFDALPTERPRRTLVMPPAQRPRRLPLMHRARS